MLFRRIIGIFILISFFAASIMPPQNAYAQSILDLPTPGSMVGLSNAYTPVLIKGLKINPDNPFKFNFIVTSGNDLAAVNDRPYLKSESSKLIKYFFAALTLPEQDVWVNLSPYEKDRIVPKATGETEIGRDMLAQDYLLKQITASLIYPEKGLGKEFWNKVYAESSRRFGSIQIPVNTFNKVWIVADKASVYEAKDTVMVVDSHLKVMLDEDYLATQKHQITTIGRQPGDMTSVVSPSTLPTYAGLQLKAPKGNNASTSELTSQLIRQIVLPALEKEVNEGKNFANLRQIFHSIILAKWYKETLKTALLNKFYSDKNKIAGLSYKNTLNMSSPNAFGRIDRHSQLFVGDPKYIYQQYLKAYKKGVFNYIKEDIDATSKQPIPRKYFSGGITTFAMIVKKTSFSRAKAVLQSLLEAGFLFFNMHVLANVNNYQPSYSNQAMLSNNITLLSGDSIRFRKKYQDVIAFNVRDTMDGSWSNIIIDKHKRNVRIEPLVDGVVDVKRANSLAFQRNVPLDIPDLGLKLLIGLGDVIIINSDVSSKLIGSGYAFLLIKKIRSKLLTTKEKFKKKLLPAWESIRKFALQQLAVKHQSRKAIVPFGFAAQINKPESQGFITFSILDPTDSSHEVSVILNTVDGYGSILPLINGKPDQDKARDIYLRYGKAVEITEMAVSFNVDFNKVIVTNKTLAKRIIDSPDDFILVKNTEPKVLLPLPQPVRILTPTQPVVNNSKPIALPAPIVEPITKHASRREVRSAIKLLNRRDILIEEIMGAIASLSNEGGDIIFQSNFFIFFMRAKTKMRAVAKAITVLRSDRRGSDVESNETAAADFIDRNANYIIANYDLMSKRYAVTKEILARYVIANFDKRYRPIFMRVNGRPDVKPAIFFLRFLGLSGYSEASTFLNSLRLEIVFRMSNPVEGDNADYMRLRFAAVNNALNDLNGTSRLPSNKIINLSDSIHDDEIASKAMLVVDDKAIETALPFGDGSIMYNYGLDRIRTSGGNFFNPFRISTDDLLRIFNTHGTKFQKRAWSLSRLDQHLNDKMKASLYLRGEVESHRSDDHWSSLQIFVDLLGSADGFKMYDTKFLNQQFSTISNIVAEIGVDEWMAFVREVLIRSGVNQPLTQGQEVSLQPDVRANFQVGENHYTVNSGNAQAEAYLMDVDRGKRITISPFEELETKNQELKVFYRDDVLYIQNMGHEAVRYNLNYELTDQQKEIMRKNSFEYSDIQSMSHHFDGLIFNFNEFFSKYFVVEKLMNRFGVMTVVSDLTAQHKGLTFYIRSGFEGIKTSYNLINIHPANLDYFFIALLEENPDIFFKFFNHKTDAKSSALLELMRIHGVKIDSNPAMRGGIDLNASKIGFTRQGVGIDIKFNQAMMARFRNGNFQGVDPEITGITRIDDVYSIFTLK